MTNRIPTLEEMERRLPAVIRLDSSRPRREPEPEPVAPIGPEVTVARKSLRPGMVIVRWTEPSATDRPGERGVMVPLPCHEAQRVRVDATRGLRAAATCRQCSESFDLELTPDSDGGHFATLTVAYVPVLISRARVDR